MTYIQSMYIKRPALWYLLTHSLTHSLTHAYSLTHSFQISHPSVCYSSRSGSIVYSPPVCIQLETDSLQANNHVVGAAVLAHAHMGHCLVLLYSNGSVETINITRKKARSIAFDEVLPHSCLLTHSLIRTHSLMHSFRMVVS